MEYRLAKLGLSNAFTLCGTPEYLAPEQVTFFFVLSIRPVRESTC